MKVVGGKKLLGAKGHAWYGKVTSTSILKDVPLQDYSRTVFREKKDSKNNNVGKNEGTDERTKDIGVMKEDKLQVMLLNYDERNLRYDGDPRRDKEKTRNKEREVINCQERGTSTEVLVRSIVSV